MPRAKEFPSTYRARKTCNRRCFAQHRKNTAKACSEIPPEEYKFCGGCNKIMEPRNGEFPSQYAARETHGVRCWRLLVSRLRAGNQNACRG